MQAFLEYVIKGLVEHPEAVAVSPVDQRGATVYEVRLHAEDVGRLIGKRGATIKALRNLLQVGGAKKGLHCSMEIVEDRPPAV